MLPPADLKGQRRKDPPPLLPYFGPANAPAHPRSNAFRLLLAEYGLDHFPCCSHSSFGKEALVLKSSGICQRHQPGCFLNPAHPITPKAKAWKAAIRKTNSEEASKLNTKLGKGERFSLSTRQYEANFIACYQCKPGFPHP